MAFLSKILLLILHLVLLAQPAHAAYLHLTPRPLRSQFANLASSAAVSGPSRLTRQGSQLYADGKVFRFVNYNAPSLILNADENSGFRVPNLWDVKDTIESVAGMWNPVVRTYTFGIKSDFASGPDFHVRGCRQYNEAAFRVLDYTLDLAAKYGVRLIIPIVNNDWLRSNGTSDPSLDYVGNWGDFAYLCTGNRSWESFFLNPFVISAFKDFLTYLLTRVNTINGKVYANDTSFAILETGNELGSWDQRGPPGTWTHEIARHVKSLAPRILVADGTLIGADSRRIKTQSLNSPYVDLFSNHFYDDGNTDVRRLRNDLKVVNGAGKAYFIGEFGLSNLSTYQTILSAIISSKTTGALIWSLRSHSYRGGFYIHSENGGHWSYHVPGFPAREPGFGTEETSVVKMIYNSSFTINGLGTKLFPAPKTAPEMLDAVNGGVLMWKGSAWAGQYEVQSSTSPNSTTWITLSNTIKDNVPFGTPIFRDPIGSPNSTYFYRVRGGAGSSETLTAWSNVIGPVPGPPAVPGGFKQMFSSQIVVSYSPDGVRRYFSESRDTWGAMISTTGDTWSFQLVTANGWAIRNEWSRQCVYHKTATTTHIDLTPQGANCQDYGLWKLNVVSGTTTVTGIEAADGSGYCVDTNGQTADGAVMSIQPCGRVAAAQVQRFDIPGAN
ncbi:hypothetical protein HK097_008856 [Rhizophlyctis rosea]|uniref:mannan endo-1,4-beta-mannosidase n=1 Tax=Rhizophlyctis rosea TaxID=64517 RepID=A0AAD5SBB1_9FUNG|nr:hypothetical protein HK097_008856 [Rhizophlyctis rosea]